MNGQPKTCLFLGFLKRVGDWSGRECAKGSCWLGYWSQGMGWGDVCGDRGVIAGTRLLARGLVEWLRGAGLEGLLGDWHRLGWGDWSKGKVMAGTIGRGRQVMRSICKCTKSLASNKVISRVSSHRDWKKTITRTVINLKLFGEWLILTNLK